MLVRKSLMIAAATVFLFFAAAEAGVPCISRGWVTIGWDGIFPNCSKVVHTDDAHRAYTYDVSAGTDVYQFRRNGKPWVTVVFNSRSRNYEIVDPNGTGGAVMKLVTPGR